MLAFKANVVRIFDKQVWISSSCFFFLHISHVDSLKTRKFNDDSNCRKREAHNVARSQSGFIRQTKGSTLAAITVETAGKASVQGCMQTTLMAQYNGKWPISLVYVSKLLIRNCINSNNCAITGFIPFSLFGYATLPPIPNFCCYALFPIQAHRFHNSSKPEHLGIRAPSGDL